MVKGCFYGGVAEMRINQSYRDETAYQPHPASLTVSPHLSTPVKPTMFLPIYTPLNIGLFLTRPKFVTPYGEAGGGHTITIRRWHGTCPFCGAKRSITRKLAEHQAYCEKCGLGFTVEYLENWKRGKEVMPTEVE